MLTKLITLVIAFLCCATGAHAQVLHLTPVQRSFPSDSVLLRIRRTSENQTLVNSTLKIDNGRVYIIKPNKTTHVDLGDRTINDFIRDFTGEHTGLEVISLYPERKASELNEGIYTFEANRLVVPSRQGRPHIAVGGGVVFIANETRPRNGSTTLMRNAGLSLDVVGTKAFDYFTLRTRVGFHSAEPVPVQKDADSTQESTAATTPAQAVATPGDPRSIVETAQAIAVGLNVDVPLPSRFTLDASQVHISLGLDVSQFWASPEEFVFPDSVRVDQGRKLLTEVFSPQQIDPVRDQLDRVLPLRTLLVGPRMLFGPRDAYVFYLSVEGGWRQYHSRGIGVRYSVDKDDPTKRTPTALLFRVATPRENITRLALGIRLTNGVDFKVDAVTPIQDRERGGRAQPILRMMVGTPGLKFGN